MKILITGATGFIGSSLIKTLLAAKHDIYALVRAHNAQLHVAVAQYTIDTINQLDEAMDIVINLAGEGIANKPWSEKRKAALFNSRVTLTKTLNKELKHPPKTLISMSAIGYYGSHTNGEYDETSSPEKDFCHHLCQEWEQVALEFEQRGTRVVIYRLGVVIGDGGALAKMRPSYRLGLGGKIGSGQQWFSWVHIQDVEKAILCALSDSRYFGCYNLTSPNCVRQSTFAQLYATSLKRPAFFTVPSKMLNWLLGDMSSLLTYGAKVKPTRLLEQGFEFRYPDLETSLQRIEIDR